MLAISSFPSFPRFIQSDFPVHRTHLQLGHPPQPHPYRQAFANRFLGDFKSTPADNEDQPIMVRKHGTLANPHLEEIMGRLFLSPNMPFLMFLLYQPRLSGKKENQQNSCKRKRNRLVSMIKGRTAPRWQSAGYSSRKKNKKQVATQSKNWKPHNMGTHGAAPV